MRDQEANIAKSDSRTAVWLAEIESINQKLAEEHATKAALCATLASQQASLAALGPDEDMEDELPTLGEDDSEGKPPDTAKLVDNFGQALAKHKDLPAIAPEHWATMATLLAEQMDGHYRTPAEKQQQKQQQGSSSSGSQAKRQRKWPLVRTAGAA